MNNLPDNLKSRLSRLYVHEDSFLNDAGKTINYKQIILEFIIDDEVYKITHKPEKGDLLILKLANQIDKSNFNPAAVDG